MTTWCFSVRMTTDEALQCKTDFWRMTALGIYVAWVCNYSHQSQHSQHFVIAPRVGPEL